MDIGDLPYTEEPSNGYVVRFFDVDLDELDYYWHMDLADRLILVMFGVGWQLQLDDQLPVPLLEGMLYPIPKETYHRIIKGTTDLVLKIKDL